MSFRPDPFQRLLLLRLALSESDGEFLKDLAIDSMAADRRKALAREGLTEEVQRSPPGKTRKATQLRLTDHGWDWCAAHLRTATEDLRRPPRKLAQAVLNGLLRITADHCDPSQGESFRQYVLGDRRGPPAVRTLSEPVAALDSTSANGLSLAESIRVHCLDLSGGQENVRVRLADLRHRMPDARRAELDCALLELERAGELSLYRLDNPQEIQPRDQEAVLRTPAGAERHLIYFGGPHS